MASTRIFIVEGDPWFGRLLRDHLSLNSEYEIHLLKTAKACLQAMYLEPHIICLDFGLPDMNGDVLLEKIKGTSPATPVIVITAQEDVSVAINFLKSGAYDYIIKGEHTRDLLWNAIVRIRENIDLKKEAEALKMQLQSMHQLGKSIVGQSTALQNCIRLAEKAITSGINVLLNGETGTGKEVFARAIHFNSQRAKKPFISINMTAIQSELVESELFGYEKGAFHGANSRKTGKFEEAQGGTLFLDEIAELNLNVQSKLLRVLQEREFTRVGGTEPVKVDARLITATRKSLKQEVMIGNFREDLFYHIFGLPIELPPLRDRGNDILILANHFVKQYAKENGQKNVAISAEAREKLLKYSYPGNVRELKAIMDLAVVMSNGVEISPGDISFNNMTRRPDLYTLSEKTLKEYQVEIINHYMHKYNNDVLLVAKKLNIGKSTLYNMLQRNEIIKSTG